ncbi:MAG TPA: hypothetical protein VHE13_14765 [Opitutus sp.]|nr:hypothetical protein [Opitutus sp.]
MDITELRHRPSATLLPALLLSISLCAFAGCVAESGYASYSTGPDYYASPDDYIYYPAYGIYYSDRHHDYIYRDHAHWVHHREPPRGFRTGSPSVHMEWHDSPEHHHAEVEHRYPRNWQPAGHDHREDHGHPDKAGHDRSENRHHDHDDDRDHDQH